MARYHSHFTYWIRPDIEPRNIMYPMDMKGKSTYKLPESSVSCRSEPNQETLHSNDTIEGCDHSVAYRLIVSF